MFAGNKINDERNKSKRVRIRRKGGISIDMSLFQTIGEVGPGDSFVKVGAGVTRNTLNLALRYDMVVRPCFLREAQEH